MFSLFGNSTGATVPAAGIPGLDPAALDSPRQGPEPDDVKTDTEAARTAEPVQKKMRKNSVVGIKEIHLKSHDPSLKE